ncbi:DUF4172 domain-containing protein [Gilvimarinus agarilyticus]|uniref:DUF4172 domain-containing protein n=1 Tax=Gilvimarinus sp. 2_MG-2023 TaxID=3062666 RepID=UPI001C08FE1A|nr:DUF4172 domain-containing protein [Gilvimarinus agarilyticus]
MHNAIRTSEIEGEHLDVDSVGLSVARQLELEQAALVNVSKPTVTRDLADLLDKGCLRKLPSGGRSTRYVVGYL